jgi:N-acetylglutamate synthase-like GNAT family acetyltransferase
MGEWNSPPIGETAERRIKDPSCALYGAFTEVGELVGVGALRTLTKDYAWIEAVRVHGKYQKIGIGTSIFKFGEELARKRNCKIVAYQTVTENTGSCRTGEKLGFTQSHEMTAFYLPRQEHSTQTEDSPKLEPIPAEEAFSLMRKIPNAPTHEICIGWDYRPLATEILDNSPDMNFFIHEDAVALEIRERDSKAEEVKWIKAIVYGSERNALLLLNEIRARNRTLNCLQMSGITVFPLLCLVPRTLEPMMEKAGFKYVPVLTGNKNVVVLFKKHL